MNGKRIEQKGRGKREEEREWESGDEAVNS